jgi:iron complex transport system substrate-binding protein
MRIISLAPAITEIIYALDKQSELVAVTKFCDWPPAVAELKKLTVGSDLDLDELEILSLEPDIILSSVVRPASLAAWVGPGQHHHFNPGNLWEVIDSITIIGELIGAEDAAQKIKSRLESGLNDLEKQIPQVRPTVYMEEWFDPPTAAGAWVPELVAIAGGTAVLAKINEPSQTFSVAQLLVADPDIIVCHWQGLGKRPDRDRLLTRPGWSELRAIKNEAIFFIDDALINRPGPRLLEGASQLNELFKRHR